MIERYIWKDLDIKRIIEVIRKKGLSFDIDGVEQASVDLSVREYNMLRGFRLKNPKIPDDIKNYYIMVDWFSNDPEIEDPLEAASAIWNSEKVITQSERVEGVTAVVQFLDQRGIRPYRITSRPGFTKAWTLEWYWKMYGDGFDPNLIRIQSEANRLINMDFKTGEIERLDIGIHFDDSAENSEKIVSRTQATVILVPQPWNYDYQPSNPRIIKVVSYTNRLKMVRAFLTLAETVSQGYLA